VVKADIQLFGDAGFIVCRSQEQVGIDSHRGYLAATSTESGADL
jgi:hypothetical protein